MDVDVLRSARNAEPFKPFVIKTIGGETHRVRESEYLAISPHGNIVVVYSEKDEAFEILDMVRIESIKFVRKGKGKPRRKSA